MQIAILLYDGFTALDAVGPYEVLSRLPGAEVRFVAVEPGPKTTETHMLSLVADHAIEDVPSPRSSSCRADSAPGGCWEIEQVLGWIRRAHETSQWTTSVCTGSLLLGAAGVLNGLRATSHWVALERLREFGAEPTLERVVEQGKVVTAAGVSSGIDMAFVLISRIAGDEVAQAIQLSIEYEPQPPFDAGSPAKAPKQIVELVRTLAEQGGAGRARPAGRARALDKLPAWPRCVILRQGPRLRAQPQPLDGRQQAALQPEPPEGPDRRPRHPRRVYVCTRCLKAGKVAKAA